MRTKPARVRGRRWGWAFATAVAALCFALGAPAALAQEDEPTEAEKEEIATLVRRLNGRAPNLRASAAGSLGGYGPKARSAVNALLTRLKGDPDVGVRCAAAEALGRIDDGSANVVSALATALGKDDALRRSAAYALGVIGPKASKAVPALRDALRTEDAPARRNVIRALGRIGSDVEKTRLEMAKLVRPGLADGDRDVRRAAALALVWLDAGDAAVVAPLGEAVGDSREAVDTRIESAEALGRLGPAAKDAVPPLVAALKEVFKPVPGILYQDEIQKRHQELRRTVARALGAIGPAAKDALPALEAVRQDQDEPLREAAKQAIERIKAGS